MKTWLCGSLILSVAI